MTPMRRAPGEVALDVAQRAAVEAIVSGPGHVRVLGAPGTGKTTVTVAAIAQAVAAGVTPDALLTLAPTRVAAARLRDDIAGAIARPTGEPMARSAASAAFAVLGALAAQREEPPPSLISGPEQDVMLREILEGHTRGEGHVPDWSGVVPVQATALDAFRDELRNLLMRAAEAGLGPEGLADLGQRAERPEWIAAAAVLTDYQNATILRSLPWGQGARYDPAEVIAAAADALDRWEELSDGPPPAWELVVVDDFQDMTAATADLLHALAARGSRLALLGNADQAVQGYRGAAPHVMRDTLDGLGALTELELTTVHRHGGAIRAVGVAAAQAISVTARASARGANGADAGAEPHVRAMTAPHRYGQSRAIAAHLREARHSEDGTLVPWSHMAVIARSGAQLRELRSDLMAAQIPCEALSEGTALHLEPGVRPLLVILEVALGREWTEDLVAEVLTSRVGGMDAVGLRRLRRALVREERAGDGIRSSAELLVSAIGDAVRWQSLGVPEARAAATISRAVAAATARMEAPGATPGAVIWAVWQKVRVADMWREAALAGSARDDADLDAVIALMRAAQTFTERLPEARIGAFLDYLEAQDFAPDSLGARGLEADAVAFATPAAAVGREWPVVVVAGVEERAWPDLRLRDTVLGAQVLADALTGRQDPRGRRDLHGARAAVLDDETRAFHVAVTRARESLLVTAVDDGETRPSRFMSLVEGAAGVAREDGTAARDVADLRGAVARLRSLAVAGGEDTADEVDALARLAALGIAGAHPDQWHGAVELSTPEPFWEDDAVVRVSPSKVDAIRTCALRWALESVGGVVESSQAQHVGSLVHEIAAELPAGEEHELHAELERRWHEIGGTETWMEQLALGQARDMLSRFAAYARANEADDVRIEAGFGVDLGRARLAGMADRVEVTDGRARIVDIKTGRKIPSAQIADHGQLLMYQLAAESGGFDGIRGSAGAALLFIGGNAGTKGSVMSQHPVDPASARDVLDQVVDTMVSHEFVATPNAQCERCPILRSCPAHAAGEQVTDV